MSDRLRLFGLPMPRLLSGGVVVRLTVTSSMLIVSACVLLSVVFVRRQLAEMRRSLEGRGRTIAEFLAREAELGVLSGDVRALRKLGQGALMQADVVYVRFFDRDLRLLASVGGASPALPAARSLEVLDDATPDEAAEQTVWEVGATITTIDASRRREELGFPMDNDAGGAGTTALLPPKQQVGMVTLGMALGPYYEQRRIALLTAVGFSAGIALLAALSAALLTWGPLRALASAAQLAAERGRVAELKSHFVTMASHEFRTPLAVILSCADVLRRYASRLTVEQRQHRLQKIQVAVRQMTDLLEDVLSVGRADAGKLRCNPEPVELQGLCQEIIADLGLQQTHAVQLSVGEVGEQIFLDRKLVRQILRNLLANAIKYSPEGEGVEIDVTRHDGAVRFRVADNGIGIPGEDLAHLFEPFHRAGNVGKIPGHGLGLPITRGAVKAHGGTIAVESEVGRGTTFVVELPCSAPPSVAGEGASA